MVVNVRGTRGDHLLSAVSSVVLLLRTYYCVQSSLSCCAGALMRTDVPGGLCEYSLAFIVFHSIARWARRFTLQLINCFAFRAHKWHDRLVKDIS